MVCDFGIGTKRFQSTLPVGGATRLPWEPMEAPIISIHAPRGGSDAACRRSLQDATEFQSTLPVGGATVHCTI